MTPYIVQLVQELKPIDHPMRFRFAKWACDRLTEEAVFGKKNQKIFRWSLFRSWRIWKQANIVAFGAQKTRTLTLKSRCTQNKSQKMSKERPLQLMAIVIEPCWTNFCLATFGFNRTSLRATRAVFKDRIFSHWADVVWLPRSCDLTPLDYYLWGAVKGKCYAEKSETIFIKPLVKYGCTQSIMCLKIGPSHVERIFIHNNWREGYWQHLVSTDDATCHPAKATLDVLRPVFKNRIFKQRPLQLMAIVIEPCWKNFCSQELKSRILVTFGFNRTSLRVTHPKLHLMSCALFLKIAFSAAELMSFGHLGAAIWRRCTVICGVASKIIVMATSQRQLTL